MWEENYDWLDDTHALGLLEKSIGKSDFKKILKTSTEHKFSGKAHYESILGSTILLNSKLNIIPAKNLISNIGIGANGTHALDSINKLPKGVRDILFMKTYELEFPLKHPKYIIEDVEYKKKLDRIMGNGYPLVQFYRFSESIFYRVFLGDFASIFKGIKRRLKLS